MRRYDERSNEKSQESETRRQDEERQRWRTGEVRLREEIQED